MKAFKLSNLCTVVLFFLTSSFVVSAHATASGYNSCVADCRRTNSTTGVSGTDFDRKKDDRDFCIQSQCAPLQEQQTQCNTLLSGYQETNKQTAQECAKSGVASINACIEAANRCTGSFSGISNSNDPSNMFSGLINLVTPPVKTGTSEDCTLEEDADKKQQKADKILQMRDDQQESVSKQADLDGEIADKQKEINEEIRKNKLENKKTIRDLDQQDRDKFSAMQKTLLDHKKKKFNNLILINKTNTEIANLEFAQQQINIELSESKIARKCFDKVMEIKNKLVPQGAPAISGQPATAAPPAKNYTLKEAQRIKQQLRDEESDCLKTERLSRAAQFKGKIDRRQELNDVITRANTENEDDATVAANDQKEYDALKISLAEEKKSTLDSETQMEANLTASLTAFEALVAKKKAALDAKIASREKAIQDLLLAKTEQKQRYADVSASIGGRQESLTNFLTNCCPTGRAARPATGVPAAYSDPNCSRLGTNTGPSLDDPSSSGNGGRGTR